MLFSQALASAVFLAIGAESHSHVNARSAETAGLAVTLSPSSGKATEVKVTIKNDGSNDLSLLRVGTILDERPVQKMVVVDDAGKHGSVNMRRGDLTHNRRRAASLSGHRIECLL